MELDALDQLAAQAFDGFIVRKDLAQRFKGQYPVPTYVGEFLLGRYCASIDDNEIAEGLQVVERQMRERTVRAGEEELFKSRARERGAVKLIDIVTARLDTATDSYIVALPSLRLTDVRIDAATVSEHERLLTGGFYAEIQLEYDGSLAQEKNGRPFGISMLRPIQLSKRGVLDDLARGRMAFAVDEWKRFLLRSIGFEPERLTARAQDVLLLRMVPFVQRNYNMVELGPRGTGKSHLYQQVSPYAHLVSGGKATVARMFVNNANGQRGLVCQYDVVCFDEISGVSFDQKDGVNIMKGYMESGEFSRGRESIRAAGSVVMVGNFDVDVAHQQRIGHLFGPLPPEMRNDTAFMDRVHAYLPGWDVPKLDAALLTSHFGLVSDFLAEAWTQLRGENRLAAMQGRVSYGGALSGRDTTAVNRTVDGLLKLLYPGHAMTIGDEELEWAVRLALECRRRVKEQQKRIGSAEFRNTHFSYHMGAEGIERFVVTPELQSDTSVGGDPLPPGQVWAISPGSQDEGTALYRLEVNVGPGSGIKLVNVGAPGPFRESVKCAEQNLLTRARELVGERDPRQHEFALQLRAFDAARSGVALGLPLLLALCGALLAKSLKGGLVAVGGLNLGGGIDPVYNAVAVAEQAVEKGASILLIPIAARRQLNELSDDMAMKLSILYYADAREALLKALAE
ncbi:MAG: BREX system Lon protease-like protein BrxL [Candidatus Viridilinea halotolerans]|uniref:BREX system Lon protease-like protein BrxL n=1 Tax=Candidatus Viridilinea halotolerans TaxID=2491704 RepID=A0A426TXC4_9CHLR|nr:MAG: BREX system Lon protease-like protein BrxL [Candidatus Viridilinea halotolerans]